MDSEKAGRDFDGVFILCVAPRHAMWRRKRTNAPKMLKNFAERQDRSMGGLRPEGGGRNRRQRF